jgi:GDP-D-mannose dehydratase
MRHVDVPELRGDSSKANDKLGWKPVTSFKELVAMMVKEDIEKYKNQIRSQADLRNRMLVGFIT